MADEKIPTDDDEISATIENNTLPVSVNDSSAQIIKTNADDQGAPVLTTGASTIAKPNSINTQSGVAKTPMSTATEIESKNRGSVAQENGELSLEYGSIAGKVDLIGREGEQLQATGTMITLTPKTMMNKVQDRPSEVHIIDMEDKTYQPRYSTIHAGDQVVFVNKDKIRHNVFSSSGNNAFDLGTYGADLKRAVTLKESGIVKIYCNIHSGMVTFIAVGNQGLSVKTDDQGRYNISEVLPGTYEVAIWNIRGETKRIVEVRADEIIELVDRIDTTAFKVEPHKNKFGEKYSKNATLFEDEFY